MMNKVNSDISTLSKPSH